MSYSIDGTYTPDLVEGFGSVKTRSNSRKGFSLRKRSSSSGSQVRSVRKNLSSGKNTAKTTQSAAKIVSKVLRHGRVLGRLSKGLGPTSDVIDLASGIAWTVDYINRRSVEVKQQIAAEKDRPFKKIREAEEKRQREAEEYQEKN